MKTILLLAWLLQGLAEPPAGRPNSRSFGTRSAGYTSANVTETLSDGAIIGVPASWEADRTGRDYRAVIVPDELIEDGGKARAAMTWLDRQCRSGGL